MFSARLANKSYTSSTGATIGKYTGEYQVEEGKYWYSVEDTSGKIFEAEEIQAEVHDLTDLQNVSIIQAYRHL
jgi:hypothetical protein